MDAAIYFGKVMHHRLAPFRHRFAYRVFCFYLDIDRLAEVGAAHRLFSYNRFNLFSFLDRDHGRRDGSQLRPWVQEQLRHAGLAPPDGRIMLLCFPRILGYVFNPLSVYYCHATDGRLAMLLYEVKNTFGEQHCYAMPATDRNGPDAVQHQQADKRFHVSPFIGMNCTYHFQLRPPAARLDIAIRQTEGAVDLLIATHQGRRAAFNDGQLLKGFLLYPLMTLKVIAAIHFEALRLWLKGAPLLPRPTATGEPVAPRRKTAASSRAMMETDAP